MNETLKHKNQRLVFKLLLLVLGMFGVGVALIPLYDVFTNASGVNGKPKIPLQPQSLNFVVDQSRDIHLDLIVSVAKDTPIKFMAEPSKMQVHPGQVVVAHYTAHNMGAQAIKAHASPSVAPGVAAAHFKVLECFCAETQDFAAGEIKPLTIRFAVDAQLPSQFKNIALALQYFKTK
ncbi:MAG: cytochrome c oxidase assembly protein [Methylococcaceae bacterium]|nr:cytochrome c oxidase assembly protein [Methylococcaceae bacterium]